jgi:hypothetical protein
MQGRAGSHYNSAADDDEYINNLNSNHIGNSSTLSDSPRSAYPDSLLSDTLLDEEGKAYILYYYNIIII